MLKLSRNSTLFFAAFAILGVAIGCSSGSDSSTTTTTGAAPAAPASPPAGGATKSTGAAGTTAAASGPADGAAVFAQSCAGCHGQKGVNGRAPVLAGKHLAATDVTTIVTNGKGRRMPAFGSRLSKDQIGAVAMYVGTL